MAVSNGLRTKTKNEMKKKIKQDKPHGNRIKKFQLCIDHESMELPVAYKQVAFIVRFIEEPTMSKSV